MRIKRSSLGVSRPEIRPGLEDEVRAILGEVRAGGDDAVRRFSERFDGALVDELPVAPAEIEAALELVEPGVLDALRTAIANVRALVQAQLSGPAAAVLEQGQHIEVAELPVRRAAIYVPGGRAPYPSTVVMGAVTARAAGVDEVVVSTPPEGDGGVNPVILAACALCEVDEVYRMGGAQAIAALAYGTRSVRAVDVIAGPGNTWVQQAKKQVAWTEVGIDGIAGPSELFVIADGDDLDPEPIALDLLAQAEHGPDSLLWLLSPDERLREGVIATIERMAPERPSVTDAVLEVAPIGGPPAVEVANTIAPEHLELVGARAEALAPLVRSAGCLFVGAGAATAFGDYVAGSNHVLPTGGAARFQSALSPATFRRRMARVSLPGQAPARLASAGAALARAEGFPVHAESMERRA